jgi:hypothetical protein
MKYGVIFWDNLADANTVFLLQKEDCKDNDGNKA